MQTKKGIFGNHFSKSCIDLKRCETSISGPVRLLKPSNFLGNVISIMDQQTMKIIEYFPHQAKERLKRLPFVRSKTI